MPRGRSRSRTRTARALAGAGLFLLVVAQAGPSPAFGDDSPPRCLGKPATIVGTAGGDTLPGTPGPDVIVALAGNDLIEAGDGDDVVCAGGGRDAVVGGAGTDRLRGGRGADTLWGGDGDDDTDAGAGVDTCFQDAGSGAVANCEKPPTLVCPEDRLRGVYRRSRLNVVEACRWFQGTVREVVVEADGDRHLSVTPDPGYGQFLAGPNATEQSGAMVVEIVAGQDLDIPVEGERVAVLGTLVVDTHTDEWNGNDWREMHPVWAIRYLSRGARKYALPPSPPLYEG